MNRSFLGYELIEHPTDNVINNFRISCSGYGIVIVHSPDSNIFITPSHPNNPKIYLYNGLHIDAQFNDLYLTIPDAVANDKIIIYYKTHPESKIMYL